MKELNFVQREIIVCKTNKLIYNTINKIQLYQYFNFNVFFFFIPKKIKKLKKILIQFEINYFIIIIPRELETSIYI